AVSSAVPLSEAQQSRLGAVLASIYGREIQLNLTVDPTVVGGLQIQVGDDLFDATVLARLSRARSQLVALLHPAAALGAAASQHCSDDPRHGETERKRRTRWQSSRPARRTSGTPWTPRCPPARQAPPSARRSAASARPPTASRASRACRTSWPTSSSASRTAPSASP